MGASPHLGHDPAADNAGMEIYSHLQPEPRPVTLAESAREQLAAWLLVIHHAWLGLYIVATFPSSQVSCGLDDRCVRLWTIGWGAVWIVGEVILALPVLLATLYLVVRLFSATTRVPLYGLASWGAFAVLVILTRIAL
jgi:hypothetical protein